MIFFRWIETRLCTYFCRNDVETASVFLRILLRFPLSKRKFDFEWVDRKVDPSIHSLPNRCGSVMMTKWANAKHIRMPVSTTMKTPTKFFRIFRATKVLCPFIFHWSLLFAVFFSFAVFVRGFFLFRGRFVTSDSSL